MRPAYLRARRRRRVESPTPMWAFAGVPWSNAAAQKAGWGVKDASSDGRFKITRGNVSKLDGFTL